MTLNEARTKLAQDIADTINGSKVPLPIVKGILSDMYSAIEREENAQLEAQYQKALESEKENEDG